MKDSHKWSGKTIQPFRGEGTSGECTWEVLYEDIRIEGPGKMGNYGETTATGPTHAPWYKASPYLVRAMLCHGVTNIGDNAFWKCTRLSYFIFDPSLESIGAHAFSGCRSLYDMLMPDSVVKIGEMAFFGCSSLREVHISNSLTEIPAHAFGGCTSLGRVKIPSSITSIGTGAFSGCPNLTLEVEYGSAGYRYAKDNNIPIRVSATVQVNGKQTKRISSGQMITRGIS